MLQYVVSQHNQELGIVFSKNKKAKFNGEQEKETIFV